MGKMRLAWYHDTMAFAFSLVSVIIPHYERPFLTREALESVVNQSYRPLEIIIGDDGSSASAREDLKGFVHTLRSRRAGDDLSFVVLELPRCGCPGGVRNRCVQKAQGDWLAFLDSDDLWLPGKLEKQYQFHKENPGLLFSHTREEWRRNGQLVSQKGQRHKREGWIFSDSLKKCIIGPSTVMMNARLYRDSGGFRDELEIAEDYEYWLRLTARCPVGYLDEALTVKRAGHGAQLSEKYGQIEIFRIRALKDLVDGKIFDGSRQGEAEAELARKCLLYSRGCYKRGKDEEGRTYEKLAYHYGQAS